MKQIIAPDFYESIIKSSADVLAVIDQAGVYKYISDAAEKVLGYAADEMIGLNSLSFVHDDDLIGLVAALNTLPAQGSHLMPLFRMKSGKGDWRWFECRATNMLGNEAVRGIVTNCRDITENVSTKAPGSVGKAYYHSLFYNHPESFFTLDCKGRFSNVNHTVSLASGFSEEELKGTGFMDLVAPCSYDIASETLNKAFSGLPHTAEIAIVSKLGRQAVLSFNFMPAFIDDRIVGLQGTAKDITKEKEAQLLIKKQENQLNNLIESISDPFIVLDQEWRYLYVNSAFAEYFGRDAMAFEKQDIWDYTPELNSTLFYQNCLRVAATNLPMYFDETFTGFSNGFTTFSISIFPFPGGVSVFFKDITFEKDLQSEFEKLSLVVSKTANGIIILNKNRKIEWINSGFTKLTGYTLVEALQKKPHDILKGPGTDKATAMRIDEKFEHSIPFSEEVLNYRKSGEEIWLKLNIVPILNEHRKVSKFIVILTDITEKKKSENRLLQLATDLYGHNRDLQQFTYIVSHNLRAPVANAVGLTNLMLKVPKEAPVFDEALDKLKISLSKLDTVIADLNSILTIRDNAHTALREHVTLHNTCNQVIDNLQEKLTACGATVSLQVSPEYTVFTNKAFLYNIFFSLLVNALKFRSEYRLLKVEIRCRVFGKNNIAISVSDNGSGMDMNKIKDHIFTLYTRFHPNTEGRGIGLFLVKAQVEALGGKIKVQSKPNVGSTFTIFL